MAASAAALVLAFGTAAAAQTAHVGQGIVVVATDPLGGFTPEGLAIDAAGNVYNGNDAGIGIDKSTYSNGAYTTTSLDLLPSDYVFGLTIDSGGTLYAASESEGIIYKIIQNNGIWTATAIITGLGSTSGVAVDGYGNVYTNNYGSTLYKYIPVNGVYTQHIIASNFELTRGTAVDSNGLIYQTDEAGAKLRVFSPNGPVATTASYTEGAGFAIADTTGVAVRNGIVYIGASTALYEEIPNSSNGYTQTEVSSSFSAIRGLAPDGSGNVFVADYSVGKIYKVTTVLPDFGSVAVGATSAAQEITFVIDTAGAVGGVAVLAQGVAGNAFALQSTTCSGSLAAGASCTALITFAPKRAGEAYGAAELTNSSGAVIATALIQGDGTAPQVTSTPGAISTLAGATGFTANQNVVVDPAGNVYVAASGNGTVYKISGGAKSLVAGALNQPVALALDGAGNLYVAESANNDVLVVNRATGAVSVIPGGSGLNGPDAIAVDGSGNVYVAEQAGNIVVKITAAGVVSTLAGTGSAGYNGDNIQATAAQLNAPAGLGIDGNGNLYIGDTGNDRVRKISTAGVITTLAGTGATGFYGDGGLATAAELNGPRGQIVVDAGGNVYFEDAGNDAIRKVAAASGDIGTMAGTGTAGYTGDNGSATGATLSDPLGLAMDGTGNLYIGDSGNGVIREVSAAPAAYAFQNSAFGVPSADSPFTETVSNIGNQSLVFSVPAAGLNPSIAAGFVLANASTCPQLNVNSASASLAAGASCTDLIEFVPIAVGVESGSMVTTDNNLNATGAAQTVSLSGTGLQQVQAISFSLASPVADGTAPIALSATGGGSDNPVTFTVVSGPGSIPVNGNLLTVNGAGPIVVAANQAGNADYSAAPQVEQTLQVLPPAAQVVFTPAPYSNLFLGGNPGPASATLETAGGQTAYLTDANVTLAISGPGGYNYSATVAAVSGVASFTGIPGFSAAGTYSYTASSAGLSPAVATTAVAAPSEPVGAPAAAIPVVFTFNAGATVTSYAVVTQGAAGKDFTASSTQPAGVCANSTYGSGAGCVVDVTFQPTSAGSRYGAVVLYNGSSAVATAYIYGTGTGALGLFTSTDQTLAITGLSTPRGLSLDGNNNVYVLETGNGKVDKFAAGTGAETVVTTLATLPGGGSTAVDGAGNLYVSSSSTGDVYQIIGGTATQIASTGGNPDDNLEVDGAGNLYLSDGTTGAIYKVAVGTHAVTRPYAGGVGRFVGMAVDPAGDLYPAGFNSDAVYELPAGASSLTTLFSGGLLNNPHGIALDPAGNIYVTNYNGDYVLRYAAGGYAETTLPAQGWQGVALDGAGDLYTIVNGSTIYEYNRTTAPTLTFPNTAYQATSNAQQSVTFENDGNAALDLTGYAASTNFGLTGTCGSGGLPYTLASGAVCAITATFTPTTVSSSPLTGTGTLTDNSVLSPTQTLQLSGTAVQAAQNIGFTLASPVVYGVGPITLDANGGASGLPVAFTLVGGPATLTGSTLTITGAGSVVVAANQAGDADYLAAAQVERTLVVSSAPLVLTPDNAAMMQGASVPALNATGAGFVYGDSLASLAGLSCSTSATGASAVGTYSITCSGAADPNYSISYGAAGTLSVLTSAAAAEPVKTAAPVLPVVFNFSSSASVASYQVLTQGAAGLDFQAAAGQPANVCGGAYAAGQSCQVNVVFQPTAPGTRLGAVVLYNGAGAALQTVFLSGLGQAPMAVFTPPTTTSYASILSVGDGGQNDLSFDAAGNLYYTDLSSGSLFELPAGGSLTSLATGLGTGSGVAVDGAGDIYYASFSGNFIDVIKPGAAGPALFASPSAPEGLAVDGNGNVFVSASGIDAVQEFNPAGALLGTFGSGLNHPQSLVVDSSDNIYVTDRGNHLSEITPANATSTLLSSGLNFPVGLDRDAAGDFYIVNLGDNDLVRDSGGVLTTVATGLNVPKYVALDGSGNIYIANAGGSDILEINRTAAALAFGSTAYGAVSAPLAEQMENDGNLPLSIQSLGVSSGFQLDSSNVCAPGALNVGAICGLAVDFAPQAVGLLSGAVTIDDNSLGNGAASQVVSLSGTGIQAAQAIGFTLTGPVSYGVGPIGLTAAGGGSGNPVTFSITSGSQYGALSGANNATLTVTGAGAITVQANQAGNTDYSAANPVSQTLTVNTAALTITASGGTMVYGTTPPVIGAGYSGFVNGDTGVHTLPVCSTTASSTSTVGSYPSSCTGAADPNYAIGYVSGSVSVTQATPVLSWANGSIVYGQALDAASRPTATVPGRFTYTANGGPVTGHEVLPAGPYGQTAAFTPADTLDYAAATVGNTLVINPAALTITASSGSFTYLTAPPAVNASYGGFVNGDTSSSLTTQPACSTTATATSTVGSYPSRCIGAGDPNYTIGYVPGSVSVTQATPVLGWVNGSITYGAAADTAPRPTANIPGRFTYTANGNPVTGREILPAGAYGQMATFTPADALDYTSASVGDTLVVNQANLAIAASNATMVYGASAPPISASYVGFVNGDTAASLTAAPVCSTTATSVSTVATYPSSCTGAVDANYNIGYTAGSVSVTPATPVVAWANGSITYGQPLNAAPRATSNVPGRFSYTANNSPVTGLEVLPAGSYGQTATFTPADTLDYASTTVGNTLVIGQANLAITASSAPMTYGGAVPAITPSYAGFVNHDNAGSLPAAPVCSTLATSSSPVGPYASSCTGAADANYSIGYTGGTVTVGQAALAITASSPSMTYGGAVPAITATYGGFVNHDTAASLTTAPTCSTLAASSSPVGPYASSCTGAADANYNIGYTTGTVTVGKAALAIAASSATLVYDQAVPGITASYAGFVNGDTVNSLTTRPACSTAAVVGSDSGSYATNCSGAVDANYAIGYVPGAITIGPAAQTVTLAALANQVYAGTPIAVTLAATAAPSGLPVAFTSGGDAASAVGGTTTTLGATTATLTISSAGSVTVTAAQAGNNDWLPASASQTIGVVLPNWFAYALYATNSGCGAINIVGNGNIDSYDSASGPYPAGIQLAGGNVGTNGNLLLMGWSTVYGTLFDPNGSTTGLCSQRTVNSLTSFGGTVTAGITGLAAPVSFPLPPAPAPAPPTTGQYLNGGPGSQLCLSGMGNSGGAIPGCTVVGANTVALAPGGYGNLVLGAGITANLSAGTYRINSLLLTGNAVLNVVSGPVVVNLEGAYQPVVFDLTGGTLVNNLTPANLQILYAGSARINLCGGPQAAGVIYAPDAPVNVSGDADWFGSIIASIINISGNSSVHYDRELAGAYPAWLEPVSGPQPQRIAFPALPATALLGVDTTLTLAATATSSLPVTYAVTGPAALSGSTLTITGAGAITVTASQAGNNSYLPATALTQTVNVVAPTSSTSKVTLSFNSAPGGSTAWFAAALDAGVSNLQDGSQIAFQNGLITFTANGKNYSIAVPNAVVTFSAAATCASTSFNASTNTWNTVAPLHGECDHDGDLYDNDWPNGIATGGAVFLTGVALPVPAAGFPRGTVGAVTWTGTVLADPGVKASWKGTVGIFSSFSTNYSALGVKAARFTDCIYPNNADQAGTPEAFRQSLIQGGSGDGNFSQNDWCFPWTFIF